MNAILAWLVILMAAGLVFAAADLRAASYSDSEAGHGSNTVGVKRNVIFNKGYARGNCANCHEQHASIDNSEPDPVVDNIPTPFALFTENYDPTVTIYPYAEEDNICFRCHNDVGSIQPVTNYNYAQTFGGYQYTTDPTVTINSILDAFTPYGSGYNTHSEHNLKDIYNYALNNFSSFFNGASNPCVACHNPHLARRNKADVDNPAYTAISRPTDHENLWGDDAGETMASYGTYQAPYYWNSITTYEPGNTASSNANLVPDYNSFCLDCHANQIAATNAGTVSRNPSTPAGYLSAINWTTGDMHGGALRYSGNYVSGATLKPPYDTTLGSTAPNYTLSCLDCHEPHGTLMNNTFIASGAYLLRKAINGTRVGGTTSANGALINKEWNWSPREVCIRCHQNLGTHCGQDIGCFNCHYHGATNISAGCGPGGWNKKTF